MSKSITRQCQICHQSKHVHQLMPGELVRPAIVELIQRTHPDWDATGYICLDDLNRYRALHVQDMLETEKGELTALEQQVVDSFKDQELVTSNIEAEFVEHATIGQRLADVIAKFGGSWTFLIFFAVVLVLWIAVNSVALLTKPFDPFPYILLNLVLSCLAAVQAPVIMMSQNRQECRDRARAEHDYRVNLKAELEIRQLHAKLDLLLTHQWQRLMDIQQMQVDLMQEVASRS